MHAPGSTRGVMRNFQIGLTPPQFAKRRPPTERQVIQCRCYRCCPRLGETILIQGLHNGGCRGSSVNLSGEQRAECLARGKVDASRPWALICSQKTGRLQKPYFLREPW